LGLPSIEVLGSDGEVVGERWQHDRDDAKSGEGGGMAGQCAAQEAPTWRSELVGGCSAAAAGTRAPASK
jgi:hypothetical protein